MIAIRLAEYIPAPFASLLLADYGANVLRITEPPVENASRVDATTILELFPGIKSTLALNLKSEESLYLLKDILARCDVLIDPFRPGVLEHMGLAPGSLLERNPRLIIARLTGFRRDGPYAMMAGHDINYLAVSGILSQLGRTGGLPYPPANILADFAGGGLMCAFGILAALLSRTTTGRGQVVENNMVDGAAYLGAFMRIASKTPVWNQPRGENLLDGGSPFYDVYECKDRGYMAVGALEPQFFKALIDGLDLSSDWISKRNDRENWPKLRRLIADKFLKKSRREWEAIFQGKDACCTPILTQDELEESGHEQRVPIQLEGSHSMDAAPRNVESEQILHDWMGWTRGHDYEIEEYGLAKILKARL